MNRVVRVLGVSMLVSLGMAGWLFAAQADTGSKDMILESSKIMGLEVYNQSDHNMKLGAIDNLLISAHTGQVLYGVVDTGVGGRIIAVPWKAFQIGSGDNEKILLLNKTKDDLAKAPTIDVNNLPDFSKSDFSNSVDNFFGVQTSVDHAGVSGLTANQLILFADRLADLNVYNRSDIDSRLGNVDNLLINVTNGELLFALVDTGIGGKNVLVPWTAFHLQKAVDENQYWLTLNKTQDELKNAPGVDTDQVASVASDAKMQQELANFFGVRTVARPKQ